MHKTKACSKGSIGKLMGDKAELVMQNMTNGILSKDNNPGYDLIGRSFISSITADNELRYEIKLRRNSVTACNFEKSKIGKFDVGIIIWYDPESLQPTLAYALEHAIVQRLCHSARAHITPKVCREFGHDFTNKLKALW